NPAVDVRDARRAQQFRKQQAAAADVPASCLDTALGAIKQTDRYAEFVGPDPGAAEVPVDRRHVVYAVPLVHPRRESGRAAKLLVPVTKQLVPVVLVEPANGTHQAASTAAFLAA